MIDTRISDGSGNKQYAQTVDKGGDVGLKVFTANLATRVAAGRPFANPVYGTNMARNVAFGAIPSGIHNGGTSAFAINGTTTTTTTNKLVDSGGGFTAAVCVGMIVTNVTDTTYANVTAVDSDTTLSLSADIMTNTEAYSVGTFWTGVAGPGTWSFTSGGVVSFTNGSNLDSAVISAPGTSSIDLDNFTSFAGKVNLTTFAGAVNSIRLQFGLAGAVTGNSILLDDYIDVTEIGVDQGYTIAMTDFGLTTELVDQLTITVIRTGGGPKPTALFDDLRMLTTGVPIEYSVVPNKGIRFHATKLVFSMAGAGTVGALGFPTHSEFIPGAALTNGVSLLIQSGGVQILAFNLTKISDIFAAGGVLDSIIDDGTDTYISIGVDLNTTAPVILYPNYGDSMVASISDNLSSLTEFRMFLRGWEEVD